MRESIVMPVHHWNTTVDGELSERALRAKIEGFGYRVAKYVYGPGTVFPDHTHGVDKIDAVISGQFRMVLSGHLVVLGPGDWIEVSRGAVHNASVVGDEDVVAFDAIRI